MEARNELESLVAGGHLEQSHFLRLSTYVRPLLITASHCPPSNPYPSAWHLCQQSVPRLPCVICLISLLLRLGGSVPLFVSWHPKHRNPSQRVSTHSSRSKPTPPGGKSFLIPPGLPELLLPALGCEAPAHGDSTVSVSRPHLPRRQG